MAVVEYARRDGDLADSDDGSNFPFQLQLILRFEGRFEPLVVSVSMRVLATKLLASPLRRSVASEFDDARVGRFRRRVAGAGVFASQVDDVAGGGGAVVATALAFGDVVAERTSFRLRRRRGGVGADGGGGTVEVIGRGGGGRTLEGRGGASGDSAFQRR